MFATYRGGKPGEYDANTAEESVATVSPPTSHFPGEVSTLGVRHSLLEKMQNQKSMIYVREESSKRCDARIRMEHDLDM